VKPPEGSREFQKLPKLAFNAKHGPIFVKFNIVLVACKTIIKGHLEHVWLAV